MEFSKALLLLALAVGVLLASFDSTVVVPLAPVVGKQFRLQLISDSSWIGTSYFITLASFQPLYGRFSDILSRRFCLVLAFFILGTGVIGCGLAKSFGVLVAMRAYSGVGGAGLSTVTSIILSDLFPPTERALWQSYSNVVFATGAALGAPIGGVLVDSIGWKWAFLVQAPLCFIGCIVVWYTLRDQSKGKHQWLRALREVDWFGSVLLVGAVSLLLLAFSRGSGSAGWKDGYTIISICIAVVLLCFFLTVEMKVAASPVIPWTIVSTRGRAAFYVATFFVFVGYHGMIFFAGQFFEIAKGKTATQAGLYLLPGILFGVSGSLVGGIYVKKTKKYFWISVAAYAIFAAGMCVMFAVSATPKRSTAGIIAGNCLAWFGSGMVSTTHLIALISNVPPSVLAPALACMYLFRSLGGAVGISLSTTILNSILKEKYGVNFQSQKSDPGGDPKTAIKCHPMNTSNRSGQQDICQMYGSSLLGAFAFQFAAAVIALIAAFFTPRESQGPVDPGKPDTNAQAEDTVDDAKPRLSESDSRDLEADHEKSKVDDKTVEADLEKDASTETTGSRT